jgi:hypothetical protein
MGYIFESEIHSIINTVLARTIGEDENIRLKQVLASDIHPALKVYLVAEVEKLLQQEREKEVRSKRFPYALPEVVSLQRQIDMVLVHEYEYTRPEFASAVDEAVHFQFNYLCRPQWTLLNFVFENNRTVSTNELERKLRYAVDYQYITALICRYVANRGLLELRYEEFRDLLARIDREVVAQHSALELARMIAPLLMFISAGVVHQPKNLLDHVLPINAAIVFYEDKHLDDVKAALEAHRDAGHSDLSVGELALLIGRVRGEEALEIEQAALPPESGKITGEETVIEFVQKEPEFSPAESGERSEKVSPLIDVYSLFSESDRRRFIKKLFRKDERGFRNALDALESATTWEEASVVLDTIFQTNDVDPFSKEAIQFTNLLQSRYLTSPGKSALG